MSRGIVSAGLVGLAVVCLCGSAAFSQGAVGPRPVDVAPRPPAAPTAPTPPVVPPPAAPPAPVLAPANPTPQVPRTTMAPVRPGSPSPSTEGQLRTLPGVSVTVGGRQLTSGADGFLSLGKLAPGVAEVSISTRSAGGGSGGTEPARQSVLIGLLLPAVSPSPGSGRLVYATVPRGAEVQARLGVMTNGAVTSATLFSGGVRVAVGDWNGDGTADLKPFFDRLAQPNPSGDTRIAFALTENANPLPQDRASPAPVAPRNTGTPSRWSSSTPLPGVTASLLDSSGRTVGRVVSDANGVLSLPLITAGKYDLVLPGTGGQQESRVLVGLLLPAVQALRLRTLAVPAAGEKRLKLDVGADGEAQRLTWVWHDGGITADDDWEAPVALARAPSTGPGTVRIALARDAAPVAAGGSGATGGPQAIAGTPLQGTDVGLDGVPGGRIGTAKTDATGTVTFTNLKPGQYRFTLPALGARRSIQYTWRDNGTLQSGGAFPVGSNVGTTLPFTMTIGSPRDVVSVKLESKDPLTLLMDVRTTR